MPYPGKLFKTCLDLSLRQWEEIAPWFYRYPGREIVPSSPDRTPEWGFLTFRLMRGRSALVNRAILRHLVIFHQPEPPIDQSLFIFVSCRNLLEKFCNPFLQFRLLPGIIKNLKNFHREQPVVGMFGLLRFRTAP